MRRSKECEELQIAQKALEELKGIDIVALDVTEHTTLTSYMLISTGSSGRHVKSLADNVECLAKESGITVLGFEGNSESGWILVDLGNVVVHVMQTETREFYNLEKLWGSFDSEDALEELEEIE